MWEGASSLPSAGSEERGHQCMLRIKWLLVAENELRWEALFEGKWVHFGRRCNFSFPLQSWKQEQSRKTSTNSCCKFLLLLLHVFRLFIAVKAHKNLAVFQFCSPIRRSRQIWYKGEISARNSSWLLLNSAFVDASERSSWRAALVWIFFFFFFL